MRITHDAEANATYIYLKELQPGDVKYTSELKTIRGMDLSTGLPVVESI